MKTEIAELFHSIQGEGIFCGSKQIFVRFASCNLNPGCSYCDTRPFLNAEILGCPAILRKVSELLHLHGPVHSISLTGGEPLLYAGYLRRLIPLLKDLNLRIYLETNGTLPRALKKIIALVDIIAMDMKLPSSTGLRPFWEEHRQFLRIGQKKKLFVKAVITRETSWQDLDQAVGIIESIAGDLPLVLQPVTPVKSARGPDMGSLLGFQARIGVRLTDVKIIPQIHKMIGVR